MLGKTGCRSGGARLAHLLPPAQRVAPTTESRSLAAWQTGARATHTPACRPRFLAFAARPPSAAPGRQMIGSATHGPITHPPLSHTPPKGSPPPKQSPAPRRDKPKPALPTSSNVGDTRADALREHSRRTPTHGWGVKTASFFFFSALASGGAQSGIARAMRGADLALAQRSAACSWWWCVCPRPRLPPGREYE